MSEGEDGTSQMLRTSGSLKPGHVGAIVPIPYYLSSIWAGNRLSGLRGLLPDVDKPIGIAREVCAYPKAKDNVVGGGPYDGWDLGRLAKERHDVVMGDDPESQLIRLAYMDPIEDLSIQVHPGEDYARRVEGDREKSESWYVLEADPGAYVVAGTTTDDVHALRETADHDGIDAYARKVPVSEGDFILIPAGTMHACGKNLLAVEVGSFGGITYRICDYGRGRALHIDRAFDVLDVASRPLPTHLGPYADAGETRVRPGVRHRLFASDVVDVSDCWSVDKGNLYHVITAVKNDAVVRVGGLSYELPYTRSLIVPACERHYEVLGRCRVLCSWHSVS